ncbi:MAG TPA: hypothetical protein VM286_04790 [Candidatus Thermoplasmatota archaeon]|nr:hypothetical protein [Candidatus Thermoplasmatota archaeon]
MRWSWPSWLAIIFGALLAVAAFWLTNDQHDVAYLTGLLIPGAILMGAGLHALQASYDSWCGDDCYGYGGGSCGCDHCGDCSGGDCCGHCGCSNMRTDGQGHDGHGHDHGEHSH